MGKTVLDVRIGEILTLAWDHPFVTGGLALMFTPPVFRVVMFFYPLIISTALCAAALISAGQHFEAARKREIAGWNAKIVDGDNLSARFAGSAAGSGSAGTIHRVPVGGEDNWLDRAQDFRLVGSALVKETDSVLIKDIIKANDFGIIKEEGRKKQQHQQQPDDAEFRFVDEDRGIEFLQDDVLNRQIEALRQYERNFSFKTGPEATTAAAGPSSRGIVSPPPPIPTKEVKKFPPDEFKSSFSDVVSARKEIPPMFLHTLRTGGMGTRADTAEVNNGGAGAISSGFPFPPEEGTNVIGDDVSEPKKAIPPMVLHTLRTGGTGRRADDAKINSGGAGGGGGGGGAPTAAFGSPRKEAVAEEDLSSGSFDSSGNNLKKNEGLHGWLEEEAFVGGFTGRAFRGKEESPENPVVPQSPVVISSRNVSSSPAGNCSEKRAPTDSSPLRVFRGKEERSHHSPQQSPVSISSTSSVLSSSPARKNSEERSGSLRRGRTYDYTFGHGNAVLYNADSSGSRRQQGYGSSHRKRSSN